MGDIWLPGYPAAYTDWQHCVDLLAALGLPKGVSEILAAIAGPESGYDYTVINDTPATGDYSVGLWQINYYDGLYAERSRLYGTPLQMVAGGPHKQAFAAKGVYDSQGFMAWSTTYTSGAWKKYLGGGVTPPSPPHGPQPLPLPPTEQARDDWSGHIVRSAIQFHSAGNALDRYARATRSLRLTGR